MGVRDGSIAAPFEVDGSPGHLADDPCEAIRGASRGTVQSAGGQ